MGSNSTQNNGKYEQDCQFLRSYLSGKRDVNKQNIVEILIHRNSQELKLICDTYLVLYDQVLIHVLSATQWNNQLARVAYLRLSETQDRDAGIIRRSLFDGSLNINTLIEILCTRSSSELHWIKQAYCSHYDSDLEHDISLKVRGGLKESLLALLKSSRNHNSKANMSMAMCDAKTLYEAMESGKSIDHMTMISLISQRNTEQIKSILISYKQLYGCEFSKSLKRNICGQFGKELRIVMRSIQSPEKFFAKQIRMRNSDLKEILIRIIITRSKIDIKDINDVFATKTGGCLENVVRREFSNSKDKDNGIVADILVEMIKGF